MLGDKIAFVSEQGKDQNKLVVLHKKEGSAEFAIIAEMTG